MIQNEVNNISSSYSPKVDKSTGVRFLRELANYVKTKGYISWDKKIQSKPIKRGKYLYVSMKIINRILKDIGTTSNKMANFLREWEDSPYIAHTLVAFYIKGRRKTVSTWVFNFEDLMQFADPDEPTENTSKDNANSEDAPTETKDSEAKND
ncbi:protein of unknown function (plasmid) [Thermococcus nautili]|uniref:hypothetical protein n=1 Tax=Thermococcus nautili TaxID=195522 RepID=UPI002554CE33|nr:hypothetical protein [Thermococcus nautili]CAI1494244.1 protein of unknown function [Thermococcus nautili]